MTTSKIYRYQLDNTSKKFQCPECRRNTFVKYIDVIEQEYLHEYAGRCDRENNCGYHLPPREFFGKAFKREGYTIIESKKENNEKIDFMPISHVERSLDLYHQTDFAYFIENLLGKEKRDKIFTEYFVGHGGIEGSCVFWRIDSNINVRTGKIMHYDRITGKRRKDISPTWAHVNLKPFRYKQCLFGEHLLSEYSNKTVGIVESEKTAMIASAFKPEIVWLATGGKYGCKWQEYDVHKVLRGRNIIFFPDFGYANKAKGITCYQHWCEKATLISKSITCNIIVSKVLENSLSPSDRALDLDIADLWVREMEANRN